MRACRDNLLPDGREGAIVPYKSNAQWIPMYQGLLKKFRASGQCKWIGSDVVREGETFEHWVGNDGEHFKHVPGDDGTKPITKVYAAALTKDSGFYVAVMSMADIQKIKNMSKASRDDSPWKVWPEEMMKKTVLRRLLKIAPGRSRLLRRRRRYATVGAASATACAVRVHRARGRCGRCARPIRWWRRGSRAYRRSWS